MSYPVFYVPAGDVLPVFFDSFAGSTGASSATTGLAVTDIEIYKDGSVTQRSSDAGYTLLDTDGLDFDGLTGINGFSIDTGDNTDSGFYAVGSWFTVVVSAVTIDSQTVSFIACQFRLMPAESIAGKPKVDVDAWLGTAAATPTTAGVPEVDLTHIAGSAVSTSTAQLGVNVVSFASGQGPRVRKNVALSNFQFLMTDSSTHSPETGATVSVTRAIDNGSFAAGTLSSVTEVGSGIYRVDFGSGDLNGDVITLKATATGCDDLFITIITNP